VTASMVKSVFIGKQDEQYSLLQIFRQHNEEMRAQVGKEYAAGTLERYETPLKLTQEFLRYKYNRDDIFLSELQYKFITDYEFFLKTVRGNSHNTASKYLRNFKKIIRIAVVNGWLDRDPFVAYKCTLREVKRDFLTQEELDRITGKDCPEWLWLAVERRTGLVVGFHLGGRDEEGALGLWLSIRQKLWHKALIFTDDWAAYASVFAKGQHQAAGKKQTVKIEHLNITRCANGVPA